MSQRAFARWLCKPPLTGWTALLGAIVMLAIPGAIRAAMDGIVRGCEFTPFLPFVLFSAILLRWWQAAGVALTSVAFMGILVRPSSLSIPEPCFLSSAGMFLAGCALFIGIPQLVRRLVQARGTDESAGGVVFSLEQGQVWASWYGSGPPVNLGSQARVETMMADFLAQGDVARGLIRER